MVFCRTLARQPARVPFVDPSPTAPRRLRSRLGSVTDVDDRGTIEARLLANLKEHLPALRQLREQVQNHWGAEDLVYRFYHQSFKVFGIQRLTLAIRDALHDLLPDVPMNARFERIIADGTGKTFTLEMNKRWDAETRPLLEAFSHANYFLDMAIKYGEKLEEPPSTLPSGWAAVLYLYNIR